MDFSISPKMQEILARVREFVEKELYPLEPEARDRGFKAVVPQLRKNGRSWFANSACGAPKSPASTAAWGCRCWSMGW